MVTFSIFISRTAPLSHGYNRSGSQIGLLFINPWAEAENKTKIDDKYFEKKDMGYEETHCGQDCKINKPRKFNKAVG